MGLDDEHEPIVVGQVGCAVADAHDRHLVVRRDALHHLDVELAADRIAERRERALHCLGQPAVDLAHHLVPAWLDDAGFGVRSLLGPPRQPDDTRDPEREQEEAEPVDKHRGSNASGRRAVYDAEVMPRRVGTTKKRAKPPTSGRDAERQLAGFIAKFTPDVARKARAALAVMRRQFRGAHELVYDNYNALAIGWSPTGRTSDVVCSIAVYPRWVSLFFFRAKALRDPEHRLRGSGSSARHVVLERGAETLDEPAVRALIADAIDRAPVAIDRAARPPVVIRSISAKQRPRRPA